MRRLRGAWRACVAFRVSGGTGGGKGTRSFARAYPRRIHHDHAELSERGEVEAGWAQVRADPLRLGNRAEALGNTGRGGGAVLERRSCRATSGGGQIIVDFPVLEPTGCRGETAQLQKVAVRVRLARCLRVSDPAEVHVLAARLRAARLFARLLRDVRAVPRQRDGLHREERGRGVRGRLEFWCFLETRGVGEDFVVTSLGNRGERAGGNARSPSALHPAVARRDSVPDRPSDARRTV